MSEKENLIFTKCWTIIYITFEKEYVENDFMINYLINCLWEANTHALTVYNICLFFFLSSFKIYTEEPKGKKKKKRLSTKFLLVQLFVLLRHIIFSFCLFLSHFCFTFNLFLFVSFLICFFSVFLTRPSHSEHLDNVYAFHITIIIVCCFFFFTFEHVLQYRRWWRN